MPRHQWATSIYGNYLKKRVDEDRRRKVPIYLWSFGDGQGRVGRSWGDNMKGGLVSFLTWKTWEKLILTRADCQAHDSVARVGMRIQRVV